MDRWDAIALVGIVLLGAGLTLLAPWLGLAVPGALLLAAATAREIGQGRADARAHERKGG